MVIVHAAQKIIEEVKYLSQVCYARCVWDIINGI